MAIGKILERLGLSSAQAEKPPPPAREVLRVAEHADDWGTPQQWCCLSLNPLTSFSG
jgi:hypothetical protein